LLLAEDSTLNASRLRTASTSPKDARSRWCNADGRIGGDGRPTSGVYLQRHRLGLVVQKSDHHVQRQRASPSLLIEPAMPALDVVISPHLLAVAGEVGWRPRAVLQPRRLHVLQQLDNSSGTRRHGGRKCVEGWPHMARRQQWQRHQLPQHTMMSDLLPIRRHEP